MSTIELQRPEITRRDPSNARLLRTLASAAASEAATAARSFAVDLLAATIHGSERAQRSTGTIFFLLLHAMNRNCSPTSRETRWRRLIRVAAVLQNTISSPALRQLIRDNADLLR